MPLCYICNLNYNNDVCLYFPCDSVRGVDCAIEHFRVGSDFITMNCVGRHSICYPCLAVAIFLPVVPSINAQGQATLVNVQSKTTIVCMRCHKNHIVNIYRAAINVVRFTFEVTIPTPQYVALNVDEHEVDEKDRFQYSDVSNSFNSGIIVTDESLNTNLINFDQKKIIVTVWKDYKIPRLKLIGFLNTFSGPNYGLEPDYIGIRVVDGDFIVSLPVAVVAALDAFWFGAPDGKTKANFDVSHRKCYELLREVALSPEQFQIVLKWSVIYCYLDTSNTVRHIYGGWHENWWRIVLSFILNNRRYFYLGFKILAFIYIFKKFVLSRNKYTTLNEKFAYILKQVIRGSLSVKEIAGEVEQVCVNTCDHNEFVKIFEETWVGMESRPIVIFRPYILLFLKVGSFLAKYRYKEYSLLLAAVLMEEMLKSVSIRGWRPFYHFGALELLSRYNHSEIIPTRLIFISVMPLMMHYSIINDGFVVRVIKHLLYNLYGPNCWKIFLNFLRL